MVNFLKKKPKFLQVFKQTLALHALESHTQMTFFGILMGINYPLYYVIWRLSTPNSYENLWLRLIATLLCIVLIFNRYWPSKWAHWLMIYWMATVCYCLPFFFTFMSLKNHADTSWLMNSVSAVFFVLLLFRVFSALLLLAIGISIGFLSFHLSSSGEFFYSAAPISPSAIFFTLMAAIIIGSVFAANKQLIGTLKENLQLELIGILKSIGGSISHDIGTPLTQISLLTQDLRTLLKKQKLLDEVLQKKVLALTDKILNSVENGTKLVEIQLNNLRRESFNTEDFQVLSLKERLYEALDNYPFKKGEKELMDIQIEEDFEILTHPVLFNMLIWNLLKNALYFIHEAGKGGVSFSTQLGTKDKKFNLLFVEDTGKGIGEAESKKVFSHFYSTRLGGTGIGLAFCKTFMEASGGSIACQGKEGEYTCFTLAFPKIDS